MHGEKVKLYLHLIKLTLTTTDSSIYLLLHIITLEGYSYIRGPLSTDLINLKILEMQLLRISHGSTRTVHLYWQRLRPQYRHKYTYFSAVFLRRPVRRLLLLYITNSLLQRYRMTIE
jgi:hypothetical protein